MRPSILAIAFIALMASSAIARQVGIKPVNEQTQHSAHMKRVVMETLAQAQLKGDGKICIFCTLIMGLTFQRSLQTGQNPGQVWKGLCSGSQNPVGKLICNILYDVLELYQIDKMDPKTSPETTCENIGFCAKPAECVLFKKWPPQSNRANPALNERLMATRLQSILRGERDYPDYNFWQDFYNLLQFVGSNAKAHIKEVFDQHIPLPTDDVDSDHFATLQTLRGANWRGRDCNDSDASIYPGRDVSDYGASIDHNCNGIYGSDSAGISYEDKFCADSDSRGVVILGDSASAHFSLPPAIFTPAKTFNDSTWDGFLHIIMDEADWPQCSWSTGFLTQDDCPLTYTANGIQSIYSMMRDRNRCNHRDFANIGVNGARSGSMAPPNGTISSWSRDQNNDKPALVFYAPIGNDVCSSHADPDHMTTPEEFRTNAMAALQYLDTQLPAKSYVVFMPLADGRLLFDILHNRTHPIGVPYPDLYDYLGCMQSSPCLGWMNTNETIRNQTQERANELSAVYVDIMANETFNNFEMALLPSSLLDEVVAKWIAQGGDPADFIEPVDGFHPSQTGNSLIAQYTYDWLNTNYPDALGAINPNNDEIESIFGDQGGY